MCLEDYIGIRGECEGGTKLYIDDLPGIDIVKVANVVNESYPRPLALVQKAFNQAQKEVLQDVLSKVNLNYNQIIDFKSYDYAGTYAFYGLVNEEVKLKIHKTQTAFTQLHVFGFQLVSDREATVDFVVSDGYNDIETIEVNLTSGLNKIALDKYTDSDYISITFSLNDFRLGYKQYNYLCYDQKTCKPCRQQSVCDCSYLELYINGSVSYSEKIGFNISVRCEANECEIMEYLTPILDLPLIYKTGINYLLEAKMSGRISSYLRNTEESINYLLTMWQGGMDNQTGLNVPSQYWHKVKQVTDKVYQSLYNLNVPIFTWSGSTICNSLP